MSLYPYKIMLWTTEGWMTRKINLPPNLKYVNVYGTHLVFTEPEWDCENQFYYVESEGDELEVDFLKSQGWVATPQEN